MDAGCRNGAPPPRLTVSTNPTNVLISGQSPESESALVGDPSRLVDFLGNFSDFLTDEAAAAAKDLLPAWAKGKIAEACSWADTQRFRYKWSSPLHFADTPG